MDDERFLSWTWSSWRSPEPNMILRLALCLAAALALLAGAIFAVWFYSHVLTKGYVRDMNVAIALAFAGVIWLLTIYVIWRPIRRGRLFILPITGTLAIALAVIGGGITITEVLRVRDEDLLIAALVLLGLTGTVFVWLPIVFHLQCRRRIFGPDNLVRVNCPTCGYSLIGLRDLRCPECGSEFTIDELIRAQNYAIPTDTQSHLDTDPTGSPPTHAPDSPPKPPPPP